MALLNTFMSYLFLLLIFVLVAGCGFAVGRLLRKRKNNSAITEENITE